MVNVGHKAPGSPLSCALQRCLTGRWRRLSSLLLLQATGQIAVLQEPNSCSVIGPFATSGEAELACSVLQGAWPPRPGPGLDVRASLPLLRTPHN